ncbi:unnamed protein product, partial [Didymodactylos carnosus]
SPTAPLSQFLDNLLTPLFKQSTPTSIESGIYVVQQLKSYSRSARFTPKTLFITFDIIDLYTMLNQSRTIFYLRRFLQGDQLTALDGLINLVLKNNYFYYDNNYYHQIKGGAMGSSLTLSLANIYMKYWEKDLVEYQQSQNELYFRFIDNSFLTSNDTEEDFKNNLDRYSSSLSILNEERTHIEISLLLNGYPLEFIKQQYSKILATYNMNQTD